MPTPSSSLATIASSASSSAFTSSSFSPTGSALLIVAGNVLATGGTLDISSVTDTFAGTGSWTIVQLRATDVQVNTGFIAYAVLGSSPGGGAITVNTAVNSIRTAIDVYEVTSFNTTTPVSQSKTGSGTSDTLSLTLDSTPDSDSLVFALCASRSGSDPDVTPGSNFTELGEVHSAGGFAQANSHCQYDDASATTTVDWSDLPTISNVGVAIEIAAAAAGGAIDGSAAGSANASGTLGGSGELVGAAAGAATPTATLAATGELIGTAAGAATATGALLLPGGIAGTAAGAATASGTLEGSGELVGAAAGAATASGSITGLSDGSLAGQSDGAATAAGTLTATGQLIGSAAGTSTAAVTFPTTGLQRDVILAAGILTELPPILAPALGAGVLPSAEVAPALAAATLGSTAVGPVMAVATLPAREIGPYVAAA